MSFTTINPATGQKLITYSFESKQSIMEKIGVGHEAFRCWSRDSLAKRIEHIQHFKKLMLDDIEEAATLMAMELSFLAGSSFRHTQHGFRKHCPY